MFYMILEPLGDQAILIRFDDEAAAVTLAAHLRAAALPWIVDIVPAYVTVAVFFDPAQIRYQDAVEFLNEPAAQARDDPKSLACAAGSFRNFIIPCCYEMGEDLQLVAEQKQLTVEQLIALHTSIEFTVYAIGFCPGFPYLGYLPDELAGVPRLATPRLRTEPGSIAITGRQCGIYPLDRPGGWPVIGRTSLELVNLPAGFFVFLVGDRVQFQAIDEKLFHQLRGKRPVYQAK